MSQYVILGAGLDTFAQRYSGIGSKLSVFEIDRPEPQAWKTQRLSQLAFANPKVLTLVPVDFEAGEDWLTQLILAGYKASQPAVVASTGVSMYLTREAIVKTLEQVAKMAAGSTMIMSFLLPIEMAQPELRVGIQRAAAGAAASGTPWLSFFVPEKILTLARNAGFKTVKHVSAAQLGKLYFSNRSDGLYPPLNSEEILVATT